VNESSVSTVAVVDELIEFQRAVTKTSQDRWDDCSTPAWLAISNLSLTLILTQTLLTLLTLTLKSGHNPNPAMSDCYIQAHDGMDGNHSCKIMQKQTPQDKCLRSI